MFRWALLLTAAIVLAACTDHQEHAREVLMTHLGEEVYLEFQSLEDFPGDVVCGEFRSNDPMHGSRRFRRFIVWGEMADDKPTKQAWDIFCSKDHAAALSATLGIGPLADPESQLSRIGSDLHMLQDALEQYLADNFLLPSSEQGLAALVAATTIPPQPTRFREGGYLAAVPLDPWARPYLYERSGLGGGVAQQFRIYTLGADGVPGGRGKDADVGTEHLKYLDHFDR